ncbi:Aspartic proteinase-like protein 1 [Vitis vinifera]|uniref:Aspartic proteinase-like protein 1 n=1 Tax=Vitis vinifera TaxID=29760 RepID=A0A438FZT0_VITVI|nr:Aspartic proteinase-like protein 1 [Vitis vinifera]
MPFKAYSTEGKHKAMPNERYYSVTEIEMLSTIVTKERRSDSSEAALIIWDDGGNLSHSLTLPLFTLLSRFQKGQKASMRGHYSRNPYLQSHCSATRTPAPFLCLLEFFLMAIRSLIPLLMAYLLVVDAAIAVTFSSKLIHRFSDEAKAFFVSRNGNIFADSWPKKRSFDYYRLLLSSDLKRQKLKLGAEYQLLFPSEGSDALFLGNEFGWLHYTWIDIGTPNVSFLVALDAGSDLLWVPCDCMQCAPLSASYYDRLVLTELQMCLLQLICAVVQLRLGRDLNEYSPSLSSTSKPLSCNDQLCELGSDCKSSKDPCPYLASYYSENTSSSGLLIEDRLHLAPFSEHASRSSVWASVIIGCGRKQSGAFSDGAAPDGLMGLGPGDLSVPSLLAKAGLVRNTFSICFDDNHSGTILFGDQGLVTQKSTSFVPLEGKLYALLFAGLSGGLLVGSSSLKTAGFQALVDSGTSFTFLPYEIYEKIVVEFDKQVNATRSSFKGSPWKYCYNSSSQELLNIPTVTLVFAMNQEFNVFCLPIQPIHEEFGIIGRETIVSNLPDTLFSVAEFVDIGQDITDGKIMHLTPPPNDRSPNPLPTNQQQMTPSRHAVAPAVAGRTPAKSAAVSPLAFPYWLCL